MSFSPFADTIYRQKYAMPGETWPDTARRVATEVMGPYLPDMVEEAARLITERKFMPGGRYLFAAGRRMHQTQNCLLLRVADSREGWAGLMHRITSGLMTGAGIGVVYSALRPNGCEIHGTGGKSTGPLALMQMVNEAGRHIMQGGSRRSAIWAGLHWWHPDVLEFIHLKDWSEEVKELKAKDYNFPAQMDGTNISVILDTAFFEAINDPSWSRTYQVGDNGDEFVVTHEMAHQVYWEVVESMLTTGEPGFSVDAYDNEGENLRNAPVTGETLVLTEHGHEAVRDLVGVPTSLWTGQQFAKNVVFKETDNNSVIVKVTLTGGREIRCSEDHPFMVGGSRVAAKDLSPGTSVDVSLPVRGEEDFDSEAYTLGWLYGDGSFGRYSAELSLCSDESKACFPWLSGYRSYTSPDSRGYTRIYFSSQWSAGRRKETINSSEVTASFVAGLFDADGNWEGKQKRIRLASKHASFLHDIRRGLEAMGILSNVSKAGHSTYGRSQTYQLVIASDYMHRFAAIIPTKRLKIDLEGYSSYRSSKVKVVDVQFDGYAPVYCADVGVPEHSFMAEGVLVSNCTEVTSYDDNDICNLGSLNIAAFDTLQEFSDAVTVATAFLLCGTLYSLVPYPEVDATRGKNRRLGLGLMGISEWLAVRGKPYAPDLDLEEYLKVYERQSNTAAAFYARKLGVNEPVKKRAIAPTGTIGILAETTTGIEPMFAPAYKRRYLKGSQWHFQYVVDEAARRLEEKGIDPDMVDTAYELAKDPGRRLKFQAWLQKYVDHGISSTINLPSKDEQYFTPEEFGTVLFHYLPYLRGITVYPDGARMGQPLTVVSYAEAKDWEGYEYAEVGNEEACPSGVCGV